MIVDSDKGFSGLDSMVSDVDVPARAPTQPHTEFDEGAVNVPKESQEPQWVYRFKSGHSGQSFKSWWSIGIVLVAFIAWILG